MSIQEAIRKKQSSKESRPSWLDYAVEKYGEEQVSDVKSVLRAIALFPFYILYWSLYDQGVSSAIGVRNIGIGIFFN